MKVKELLRKSYLYQRIFSLVTASFLAQAMSILAIAIISRNLSVFAVGEFQVAYSYILLGSTVVLLAYHVALPIVVEEDLPYFLLLLFTLNLFNSSLVCFLLHLTHNKYALTIALGVLAFGFIAIAEKYFIRFNKILPMSLMKLGVNLVFLICIYVSNFKTLTSDKIIHYFVLINLLFAFTSIIFLKKYILKISFEKAFSTTKALLLKFKKNAIFIAPSELLNSLTYNLPTIIISKYFGNDIAGQFSVIMRFCLGPLGLFGDSAGRIMHAEMSNSVRHKTSSGYKSFNQAKKLFFILGLCVFFASFIIAPYLIILIFGPKWHVAGTFAKILSPLFSIMMFVSPFSVIFYVFPKQVFLFYSQALYFLISLTSFLLAAFFQNIYIGMFLFSFLSVCRYLYLHSEINKTALALAV